MIKKNVLHWTVSSEEDKVSLLSFLSNRLEGNYSHRALKKIIEQNTCFVNARVERFSSRIVGVGDEIVLNCCDLEKKRAEAAISPILYEDEYLIAFNKPTHLKSDLEDFKNYLSPYISSAFQLVHRLDIHTTGVCLLAKQASVLEFLIEQFKKRTILKKYKALVEGYCRKENGVIESYLAKKCVYQGQTIWGSDKKARGRYAHTAWKRVAASKKASLIECLPTTGRTHQIRIHMAELGHPLIGDLQYNMASHFPYFSHYFLHAEELVLIHPLSKKELFLKASFPNAFLNAQKAFSLEKYA